MDSGGTAAATNSRYYRKPPYSDRLLGIFSTSSSTSQAASAVDDELTELDIFDSPISDSIPSTSSNPNPNHHQHQQQHHHHHHRHSPNNHKHFGILAALPESDSHAPPPCSTLLSVSSSSSSSSSSARLIPTIPKRPPPPPVKFLQSAPVNVPVMLASGRAGGGTRHFDDNDDDDDDDDVENGEMLPPHELVASRYQTPVLASSVLEGAGRKLKGRDLRQVRNAIWRRTGFLD